MTKKSKPIPKLHPAISHINATPAFLKNSKNIEALNTFVEAVLKKEDKKNEK